MEMVLRLDMCLCCYSAFIGNFVFGSSRANQVQNQTNNGGAGNTAKQRLQQERQATQRRSVQAKANAHRQCNTDDCKITLGKFYTVKSLDARCNNTAYDNQHNSPQYGIRNQIDYGTDFGEEADNNQHSAGNRNNIAAGNTGNSNDAETVAIGSIGKGVK